MKYVYRLTIELNRESCEKCREELEHTIKALDYKITKIENINQKRTISQNSSLHLYLTQWAKLLNEHGIDMKMIVKKEFPIPATMENLKECVWKKLQTAMYGKESTTELSRNQIDPIVDIITKEFGQRYGLYVPFPCEEEREKSALSLIK